MSPSYCDVDDQLSLMEAGQWPGPGAGPGPAGAGAGLTVVAERGMPRPDLPLPAGTIFRIVFLGSVEVEEEGTGRKRRRRLKKTMVEEAVTKIKVCGLSVHNPVMSCEWLCVFNITFLFIFISLSHSFYSCSVTFIMEETFGGFYFVVGILRSYGFLF